MGEHGHILDRHRSFSFPGDTRRYDHHGNEDIGLCKVAPMDGEDGIIDQDYSLNAGRYVGVVIEDDGLTQEEFKEEMYSLNAEFTALSAEAKALEELIANNLKGLLGE